MPLTIGMNELIIILHIFLYLMNVLIYTVAKLSKTLAVSEAELEVTSEHNQKMQEDLSKLKLAHERLIAESASKIPAREHVTAVNDLKK